MIAFYLIVGLVVITIAMAVESRDYQREHGKPPTRSGDYYLFMILLGVPMWPFLAIYLAAKGLKD